MALVGSTNPFYDHAAESDVGCSLLDVLGKGPSTLGDESATWKLQGGRSGHGTLFDDIKLRVWPQEKVLILKRNSYLNPNERFVYF